MTEYIDRHEAVVVVSRPALTRAELRRFICQIPTADVKLVVKGKWINTYIQGVHHYQCTNCGEYIEAIWTANFDYNFCPNCGADMREG